MDLIEQIKVDYSNFCDKEYVFYLEDKSSISLKCKMENLPHLIGLHKLKDDCDFIRQMVDKQNYIITPRNIFDVLKENNIGYNEFRKYESWTTHIKDRMENFTYEKINSILRKTTMFSYIFDKSKNKNNKAKYVLIDKKDSLFLQLYIGYDDKLKYYYPNSYVPNKDKDSNLDRKTLKIIKTEIFVLSTKGKIKLETIEHAKIREIKKMIKEYDSKNYKLYKTIEKNNDYINILDEVNILAKEIIKKYNDFEECNDKDINYKLELFLKKDKLI